MNNGSGDNQINHSQFDMKITKFQYIARLNDVPFVYSDSVRLISFFFNYFFIAWLDADLQVIWICKQT